MKPRIKFHGNRFNASRSETIGQTDRQMEGQRDRQLVEQTDGWIEITNLIGAYHYYNKAHKTRSNPVFLITKQRDEA